MTTPIRNRSIGKLLLIGFLSCFVVLGYAQKALPIPSKIDFEANSIFPWIIVGNSAKLSNTVYKNGNQSLEIASGSSAQCYLTLEPNSTYQITAWVKTESGSDEIQLNMLALAENNISLASALTSWTLVKKEFHSGASQNKGIIEFANPENASNNSVWVDDIQIERIGDYASVKPAGIKPLPARKQVLDQGILAQPDEKLTWLLDAKFGMFIHWGLYSAHGKGEWIMNRSAISPEDYRVYAYPASGDQYFSADKYDPKEWAKLAKAAGMKYMNLTTMHHDGYALFESKYMDAFTSKQTHNRDLVKEYVEACRGEGLKVGLYKTLINWRYPGYYDVSGTDCKPNPFGYTTDIAHKENARLMKEELYCQIKELMTKYGKIDQIFWDGGWLGQQGGDADGAYFWESGKYLDPKNQWPVNPYFQDMDEATGKPLGLMGIVRKYQPDIIVNPRCGWYGDIKAEEGNAPITGAIRTEEIYEKCMSIGTAWGYASNYEDPKKIKTLEFLKRMLSDCVIRNMVYLLNVGPDKHGQIPKPAQDRLLEMGKWLEQVGEAVYGTRGGPWNPKDGQYGFAYKGNTIYVYLLSDFVGQTLTLPSVNKGQKAVKAYVVSDKTPVKMSQNKEREITLSGIERLDKTVTILAVELNKKVME
ncbi:MAG: alpha-L-fucosidase [Bacteroidia bacterium]|nr:alpha-L-fucosidase [Bacteroidia bacterium]